MLAAATTHHTPHTHIQQDNREAVVRGEEQEDGRTLGREGEKRRTNRVKYW